MFCRTSKEPDVLLEMCDASPLECLPEAARQLSPTRTMLVS